MRAIILVGIVGLVLTLATLLFVTGLFYDTQRQQDALKVYDGANREVVALHSQQEERLHGYRWIDERGKVVAIPIEEAMRLVADDLKAGRPAVSAASAPSSAPASQPAPASSSSAPADPALRQGP